MENIVNSCVAFIKIFRLSLTKYMCCVILFILVLWGDVMKRILIFSDTHGNTDRCINVIEKILLTAILVGASVILCNLSSWVSAQLAKQGDT